MRRELTLVTLLLLVSAGFLMWGIHITHMRADEQLVYFFTRFDNLPQVIDVQARYDVHPPLWMSIFWSWRQLVGDSEFAGRMHALLLAMLTLALTYRLGRRWFGHPRAGLFAVALLVVNSLFFIYALEIRHYSMLILVAAWSMWCFERWLAKGTRRTALWYGLSVAGMLYVHYFLGFLLMAQVLYLLLTRRRDRIRGLVEAGVVAVVLYLPWLPALVNQVGNLRGAEQTGGNARGVLGIGTTTQITSPQTVAALLETITNGQFALYALIFAAGFIYLRRNARYRLALAWAIGGPALALLFNLVLAVYAPRYNAYLAVGWAVAAGGALAALPRLRLPALIVATGLTFVALPAHLPQRTPYRDLFAQVSALARPGDVILFDQGGIEDRFVRWQVTHYLDVALATNQVTTVEQALDHRRVWYATANWFADDVRARFDSLDDSHPVQDIVGDCTRDWCYLLQLMEAPPRSEAIRFDETLGFRGLDLDAVTNDRISARLWWTVAAPVGADYSIGLHLLDESGQLVAQSDGPINDIYAGPVQTSALEPERIYIDRRTLDLPPDLPPGTYQLALTVYQPWDGVRLVSSLGETYLPLEPVILD
jgi:hypothetical protein